HLGRATFNRPYAVYRSRFRAHLSTQNTNMLLLCSRKRVPHVGVCVCVCVCKLGHNRREEERKKEKKGKRREKKKEGILYGLILRDSVLILAAILDLVLVFRRKCILVLVTFSHFYPP